PVSTMGLLRDTLSGRSPPQPNQRPFSYTAGYRLSNGYANSSSSDHDLDSGYNSGYGSSPYPGSQRPSPSPTPPALPPRRQPAPSGYIIDGPDGSQPPAYQSWVTSTLIPRSSLSTSPTNGLPAMLSAPVALPQLDLGDGVPFVRGYSAALGAFGISQPDFIRFVDAVNMSEVPNPEMAIAAKAMGLASWFVPGAGSIALSVGQIGAQVGSGLQLKQSTANALARANSDMFNPVGLEVAICSSQDVERAYGQNGFGIDASSAFDGGYGGGGGAYGGGLVDHPRMGSSWQSRLQAHGPALAPLTTVLAPLQNPGGRSDPLAQLGQGLQGRSQRKAQEKAQKRVAKGKDGGVDMREAKARWLVVRPRST
ncbi:hypothetical protein Q5752_005404, partial [Cryptotrichosporon argae]